MAPFVICVSGGPDSMALLHMCRRMRVAVCHVNYRMRPTADRDEAIVAEFCRARGIQLCVQRPFFAPGKDRNFQAWARAERYGFAAQTAKAVGAAAILTAHNRDDFLETA